MKTNYHTHSIFCDGKISPEEMVLDAIKSDFDILGFSAHAIYPFQSEWHLKNTRYAEYCSSVRYLTEKYADKIKIMLGFEADYLPLVSSPARDVYSQFSPDFIIGSVHYIVNCDEPSAKGFPQKDSEVPVNCFAIDGPENEVRQGIQNMFGGNGKLACQNYFALEREMIRSCDFDIIGHPDILRKRNSSLNFFSPDEEWYKNELMETAAVIAKSGKVTEINYGGIARGTLNDTYPSLEFLKLLNKLDVPVTVSADAHNLGQLNNGYDFAVRQAKTAGFSKIYYLSGSRWESFSI